MKKIEGIMPALITPLTRDEKINVPVLNKLIDRHLSQGADGFYIGGATGEGFLLDFDERKTLCEKAVEFIGDNAVKIVHITDMNMNRTIELARHAEKAGADAISAVPPFYFSYDEEDIYNYYVRIADAVSIPLMIYYTPAAAAKLSLDLFKRLLEKENITAVKWTYSDYDPFIQLRAAREDITVMNGPDEMLLCGLAAGADGGIGSTYNFLLPQMKAIYAAYKKGDMAEALGIQRKVTGLIAAMKKYPIISGVKAILEYLGFEVGAAASPQKHFSDEEKKNYIDMLISTGLFDIVR